MTEQDKLMNEWSAILPEPTKREDFNAFWAETLAITKAVPLRPLRKAVPYPFPSLQVYDIQYCGFDDTPIHGWFILPRSHNSEQSAKKHPCLIHYHGYGGNRGLPCDHTVWTSMGVAVLTVDCRGQSGATGNQALTSSGSTQGVACLGILDKNEYYFRAVYMDCLKAIDFAAAQPEVDAGRIIIEGGSQGGALGMAVCSLDERPWLALLDVPSNSYLEERVRHAYGAFSSVTEYLKIHPGHTDRALETLSYFDTMNMAEQIRCPLLVSVGGQDQVCPPYCYFASYNRINAPKEICVYPYNGHEGGRSNHLEKKLAFLARHLQIQQS